MSRLQLARRFLHELWGLREIVGNKQFFRYLFYVVLELPEIVRSRTLIPADHRMAPNPPILHVFGAKIRVCGKGSISAARELYARKVYFAAPQFCISAGDTVVDLGANEGIFTVLAAALGARVVAVEAQSDILSRLLVHVRLNSCQDAVAAEWGVVGAHAGSITQPGWPPLPGELKMDEIVGRNGILRIDFLKVDVEGSEFDLFSNPGTWLNLVQKIAMEIHLTFGDPAVLSRILSKHGFKIQLRNSQLQVVNAITDSDGYLYAWR